MKTQIEIQRAHDLLISLMRKEIPVSLSEREKAEAVISCNVLCWILNHDHNLSFQHFLEALDRRADDAGFRLEFKGN